MKFTAFVLASAAATASAQTFVNMANPFMGGFTGGLSYPVQQPVYNPYLQAQPYPVAVPQQVDPLAWERDCTWFNSVNFRAALSRATCGFESCISKAPNGNGGGNKRSKVGATTENGFHVWSTVINRAGRVCAVAYTGQDLSQQFPYGRILSAKLANTANSLSLPARAMPSHVRHAHPTNHRGLRMNGAGNQWYMGPLRRSNYHLPFTITRDAELDDIDAAENMWYGFTLPAEQYNPGNVDAHYQGAASNYGEACGSSRQDPLCMQKPGGFSYQAGGLALYDAQGVLRGAIGVAGDNDCANHAIAWKAREQLGMDYTPVASNNEERNFPRVAASVKTSILGLAAADTDDLSNSKNSPFAYADRTGVLIAGNANDVEADLNAVEPGSPWLVGGIGTSTGSQLLNAGDDGHASWDTPGGTSLTAVPTTANANPWRRGYVGALPGGIFRSMKATYGNVDGTTVAPIVAGTPQSRINGVVSATSQANEVGPLEQPGAKRPDGTTNAGYPQPRPTSARDNLNANAWIGGHNAANTAPTGQAIFNGRERLPFRETFASHREGACQSAKFGCPVWDNTLTTPARIVATATDVLARQNFGSCNIMLGTSAEEATTTANSPHYVARSATDSIPNPTLRHLMPRGTAQDAFVNTAYKHPLGLRWSAWETNNDYPSAGTKGPGAGFAQTSWSDPFAEEAQNAYEKANRYSSGNQQSRRHSMGRGASDQTNPPNRCSTNLRCANPTPVQTEAVLSTTAFTDAVAANAGVKAVAAGMHSQMRNSGGCHPTNMWGNGYDEFTRTTDSAAPNMLARMGGIKGVEWAGKKAEDNVIFSELEQELFPNCQNIISRFAVTNPTDASIFTPAGK